MLFRPILDGGTQYRPGVRLGTTAIGIDFGQQHVQSWVSASSDLDESPHTARRPAIRDKRFGPMRRALL